MIDGDIVKLQLLFFFFMLKILTPMPHGSDKPEIQSEQKNWCKIRQCDFSSIVGSSYRTSLGYVITLLPSRP